MLHRSFDSSWVPLFFVLPADAGAQAGAFELEGEAEVADVLKHSEIGVAGGVRGLAGLRGGAVDRAGKYAVLKNP